MYKRTLFALAIAASVAIAQPPAPQPVCLAAPAPCRLPVNGQMVHAEMTIVRLHPEAMKALELWDEYASSGQKCFLSACQVRKILNQIKEDDRCEILSSPQMVMLDSQHSMVHVDCANGNGFSLNLTPRVSLDHKFIQLGVSAEYKEAAPCHENCPCQSDDNSGDRRTAVQLHQCETVVAVPTGKTVMWEICRPKSAVRCDLALGSFFQAEVVASKERHVCVIVTPTEVNEPVFAQPMPMKQPECVGPCQVFMPAPPMMAMPPMMPCEPGMPGCWAPNRSFAFVPAQEQTERATPRTSNRTLEKLLEKYDDACANGDLDKARKLARRCIDIDPTCFMQDR